MTSPENHSSIRNVLDPQKYQERIEPTQFDPLIHCAGALDWLAAGGEDTTEFAASLSEFVAKEGFKPLYAYSKQYTSPHTFDEVDRFTAATAFLKSEGINVSLITQLDAEMLTAVRELDANNDIRLTRAVITAEALARGEYDPFNLIFNAEILQAGDFR